MLDSHAQPSDTRWNSARRADRTIHEMLGLVKGVIADGKVSSEEAFTLHNWICANPEAAHIWPGDALAQRLQKIFADRVVDAAEQQELYQLLQDVTGERSFIEDGNAATRLPLDTPPPELVFENQTYVFTGRFLYGTRSRCEQGRMPAWRLV
jgi:hypothetical protein